MFFSVSSDNSSLAPACPIYMDIFEPVEPEDMDKLLKQVRPTTGALDPRCSWLTKLPGRLAKRVRGMVHASLRVEVIPPIFKETVIGPVLKKPP